MSTRPFVQGQSRELRKGRVLEDSACYAISKAVDHRRPVLATNKTACVLIDSWKFLRSRGRIKLFAFCIMPDHYHLVLCLMPGEDLSTLMKESGRFTARELNKSLGKRGRFWQEGFYDRRCRDENELHDLCLYIENNPIRAGLVTAAEEWPYSSAFAGNRDMLDREWWP